MLTASLGGIFFEQTMAMCAGGQDLLVEVDEHITHSTLMTKVEAKSDQLKQQEFPRKLLDRS